MKKLILGLTAISLLMVSCEKEAPEQPSQTQTPQPPSPTGTVTDVDGNQYNTIVIGNREWMMDNLRTTKYCNGDPIPNTTTSWVALTTGAWVNFENDNQNDNTYGKLYNWYAVNDERNICPCGWRVATDDDWTALTDQFGGLAEAGGNLKQAGTQQLVPTEYECYQCKW